MVSFDVLRAARVNVRGMAIEGSDATVALGEWGGVNEEAAADIAQRLREIITNAPGQVVQFIESGGVVSLHGTLHEHLWKEQVKSFKETCSRLVDAKIVKYPCTRRVRSGEAKIRVSMNVIDGKDKTVASDSFEEVVQLQTQAVDADPPGIDWDGELSALRAAAAADLAQMVVPYEVKVAKPWFGCGDADTMCEAGLVQIKHGNFEKAEVQFRKAIDTLKGAGADPKDLAGAWWALTLCQQFSGNYAGAGASLDEAISLDPKNEAYAAELKNIEQERKNARKLSKQGIGDEE